MDMLIDLGTSPPTSALHLPVNMSTKVESKAAPTTSETQSPETEKVTSPPKTNGASDPPNGKAGTGSSKPSPKSRKATTPPKSQSKTSSENKRDEDIARKSSSASTLAASSTASPNKSTPEPSAEVTVVDEEHAENLRGPRFYERKARRTYDLATKIYDNASEEELKKFGTAEERVSYSTWFS